MSYSLSRVTVISHRFFHAGDSFRMLMAPGIVQPCVARGGWRCRIFLEERSATMADIPQWWMKGHWFDV
jgi:hypothetical protein